MTERAVAHSTSPVSSCLLELRDVAMSFRSPSGNEPLRVLTDVNLVLPEGDALCVAGRSGSGKTTLLHVAAGFLGPTAGAVLWRAEPIAARYRDGSLASLRRGFIGFVFQNGGLILSLTAAENVALACTPSLDTTVRARSLDLLEAVGLRNRAAHFPAQLSGGEQQRVALARALAADPAVLMVDEPTANLDRASADELIVVLFEMREAGKTLLVASHDSHIIERADRVFWLI